MNKNELLAYPIIDELQYRQNIDPVQLNTMLRSLDESVLRSILRGTEVEQQLNRLVMGTNQSYLAMAAQYTELRSIAGQSGLYATAFPSKDPCLPVPGIDSMRRNSSCGVFTLDWVDENKFSKIPIVDGIVSPSVKILVDDVERDTSDPVYNILNRVNDSFWIEQTSLTGPNNPHTLEIQLPPSINKKLNFIEVVPFPVFGIKIKSIIYYDTQNQPHYMFTADNMDSSKTLEFYNNMGPLSIHISPVEFNNTIKIEFEVDPAISSMGFSNISIAYIDYNSSAAGYIPFENLPVYRNAIYINTIDLDYYVDNGQVDSKEFLHFEITNTTDGTGDIITIPAITKSIQNSGKTINIIDPGKLYLKVTLSENTTTTPMFRGCYLSYT